MVNSLMIEEERESAMDFPLSAFPEVLREFATKAAESIGCPVDFVAVPMLAVAGAALGNSREIELKPGWREGARICAAMISPPGTAKSPALNLVARPVVERQKTLKTGYDQEKKAYESELRAWEGRKKQKGNTGPQEPPPEKPTMARTFTTDFTVEALGRLLRENPRGVLLIQDELSRWVRAMDQYKKKGAGSDRQFFLSAWSGQPVLIDRKSDAEPSLIERPFLSVVGGMTPDMLGELVEKQDREDGFLHRIVFSYPETPDVPLWSEATVPEELMKAWSAVIEQLYRTSGRRRDDEEGAEEWPIPSVLTADARELWIGYFNNITMLIADYSEKWHLRGVFTKLRSYAARFALILQHLRIAAGETENQAIEQPSVLGATLLSLYFESHARKVYGVLNAAKATDDEKEEAQAQGVLEYIRENDGKVKLRQLYDENVAGIRNATEAKKIMFKLTKAGLVDMRLKDAVGGRGGKRSLWLYLKEEKPRLS